MLANYAEIRYHKDVGFRILLFILFLLPTAVFLAGFAYNRLLTAYQKNGHPRQSRVWVASGPDSDRLTIFLQAHLIKPLDKLVHVFLIRF